MPARRPSAPRSSYPILDGHVHMAPWDQLRPDVADVMRKNQPDFARVQAYQRDPRRFLKLMDQEDVERAFLINYVAPEVMGFDPSVNRWVHDYAQADPDRLIPFGGLHPLHVENPRKDVEELLSTYELGGIKIHPPHQLFAPNDYKIGGGVLQILYEACQSAGVPVMVHTGTSIFPGARNKFADPLLVDDIAVDYPKLKIILAHAGRPLWMETVQFLVRRHKNVWMDISSIPPHSLLDYFPRLESLSDKVLFGSDWPGPMVPGMRANADAVLRLPLSASAKKRILRENGKKVLR